MTTTPAGRQQVDVDLELDSSFGQSQGRLRWEWGVGYFGHLHRLAYVRPGSDVGSLIAFHEARRSLNGSLVFAPSL